MKDRSFIRIVLTIGGILTALAFFLAALFDVPSYGGLLAPMASAWAIALIVIVIDPRGDGREDK